MIRLWTVEVIANLRIFGIKQKDCAKQCGYTPQYMSQVLRGRKSTEQAKKTILAQIERISEQYRQGNDYEQRHL